MKNINLAACHVKVKKHESRTFDVHKIYIRYYTTQTRQKLYQTRTCMKAAIDMPCQQCKHTQGLIHYSAKTHKQCFVPHRKPQRNIKHVAHSPTPHHTHEKSIFCTIAQDSECRIASSRGLERKVTRVQCAILQYFKGTN